MSSITLNLYEENLKPNKCHTNHNIQIVLCKTALMQLEKELYRRTYKLINGQINLIKFIESIKLDSAYSQI